MAPEVKTAKNSKLPKLSENCFEPVGKGGWPLISTWIKILHILFVDDVIIMTNSKLSEWLEIRKILNLF
jgi:hypothetical protein